MYTKILIADDTHSWLDFHTSALNIIFDKKVELTTATSARDAYDKIMLNEKNPFDLIITDLQMESDFAPMIAGEWLVHQIQNFTQYRNSQIIIVSAMYNIEMTAHVLGVEFISKRSLVTGLLPLKLKLEAMGFKFQKEN